MRNTVESLATTAIASSAPDVEIFRGWHDKAIAYPAKYATLSWIEKGESTIDTGGERDDLLQIDLFWPVYDSQAERDAKRAVMSAFDTAIWGDAEFIGLEVDGRQLVRIEQAEDGWVYLDKFAPGQSRHARSILVTWRPDGKDVDMSGWDLT